MRLLSDALIESKLQGRRHLVSESTVAEGMLAVPMSASGVEPNRHIAARHHIAARSTLAVAVNARCQQPLSPHGQSRKQIPSIITDWAAG